MVSMQHPDANRRSVRLDGSEPLRVRSLIPGQSGMSVMGMGGGGSNRGAGASAMAMGGGGSNRRAGASVRKMRGGGDKRRRRVNK